MEHMSALVILVPEAEPLVSPFRSKYDSSAVAGMAAHITINFPFLAVEQDEAGIIRDLKDLFSGYETFRYTLATVKRFPGIIYLSPSPARPFIDLIRAVAKRFPQSPPYGGEYKNVVPHLTVAVEENKQTIEDIYGQFTLASIRMLPIPAFAKEIWLVDNKSGMWTKRVLFALAENIKDGNGP